MRKPYRRLTVCSVMAPWPVYSKWLGSPYASGYYDYFPMPFWRLAFAYAKRVGLKWRTARHRRYVDPLTMKPIFSAKFDMVDASRDLTALPAIIIRAIDPGDPPPASLQREGFWPGAVGMWWHGQKREVDRCVDVLRRLSD
jgi:hypothetical protein